jgi:heme ABC exporter ATP-binding subunit CcmA
MDSVVHLRAAVSLLGRFPALAGVDLDVAPSEIVLVRGPNGAGKTTLLRLCAGLAHLTSGEAVVLGCDIGRDPRAVRARVGLLGHATALYDDLNVADNVRFWSRAAGARSADTEEAIEQLGLGGRLAKVPVARLSAGQRRRAALAILVARRPELWLLDEPHAGLDAAGRDLLDELLADAVAAGATVVFASHELDRAEPLAHRVVTMAGGQVEPVRRPLRPPDAPQPVLLTPSVPC